MDIKNAKGNMGMGTLIIFIAMIIVAAIAASVLISTTTSLQNKALETGTATKEEVGTSITVLQVYGEDGSSGNDVQNLTATVKLKAGSEPVRFEDLLLSLGLDNASEDYTYSSNISSFSAFYDNGTLDSTNKSKFFVSYAIQGETPNGTLGTGDVAKLQLAAPRAVGESEVFNLDFTPQTGLTNSVSTRTPGLISNQREQIYP